METARLAILYILWILSLVVALSVILLDAFLKALQLYLKFVHALRVIVVIIL